MSDLRLWVMTDLEGVAGVFGFEDYVVPTGRWYGVSRKLLTEEVNAAVQGAVEAGASQILVVDGHGWTGIDVETLDDRASLLSGRPLPLPWGLDKGFDAAFIIGQHAMAGAGKAHLSHTENHMSIQNVWINGRKTGELGIVAAVAGYFDVRTVLVTGDKAACLEAKAVIPEVETVGVKEGLGIEAAISISPSKSRGLIREAAKRALLRKDKMSPYRLERPIELVVEYTEAYKSHAERLAGKPCTEQEGPRIVRIRDDDLLAALAKWF